MGTRTTLRPVLPGKIRSGTYPLPESQAPDIAPSAFVIDQRRVEHGRRDQGRPPDEKGKACPVSDIPGGWRFPRLGETRHPVTKTDLAYCEIRQMILEGELPPGAALDQEALAKNLDLSTTPVREALRRLESERLVVNRAHRETVVAPLSLDIVEDVYAVRLSLDPLAAGLAATQATDGERKKILALSRERSAKNDAISNVYQNRHLHRSIYAAAGNPVLTGLLDSLWDLSDRYRMVISRDRSTIEVAQEEHVAIAEAVVGGEAGRAAQLMREHLASSLQMIRLAVA
jgi:DNA-binding GntR family transcriptional regulator